MGFGMLLPAAQDAPIAFGGMGLMYFKVKALAA